MTEELYKTVRLYLNAPFEENAKIILQSDQAHYLRNVLRKDTGDFLRVFNGRDGEWLAEITDCGKKEASIKLKQLTRLQGNPPKPLWLYFAPIKKQRMDFLIEKAVELGVTHLCPIITRRTENRNLNTERLRAQIIEAAEQCERLDIPVLQESQKMSSAEIFKNCPLPVFACLERSHAQSIAAQNFSKGAAFIIGPEGGFDNYESEMLSGNSSITPLDLGDRILRAETACLACLSFSGLKD